MKKIAGPLAAVLVLVAGPAAARSIDDPTWESSRWPKNTLTANPALMIFFGLYNLQYERAVSEKVSVFGGPTYWNLDILGAELEIYMVDVGLRYFLTGQAPEGFFVSPAVGFVVGAIDGDPVMRPGWTASAMLGYTWLFGRFFDLSLGFGGTYVNLDSETHFVPSGRAAVGIAF